MSKLRVAAKFFTIGLALGLAIAPRSGREMRARLRTRIKPGRQSEPGAQLH